ncbi:MAG: IPT/TIG domain-containing protein [Actinobacteria bacterium]|nr:IPT/TIG domain-containing protein [Actinomycetota bacterium]
MKKRIFFTVLILATLLTGVLAVTGSKAYPAPPVPTLTSISPTSGPQAGGTTVTLTGTGFSTASGATTVLFGTGWLPATNIDSTNPLNSVSCVSASFCVAVDYYGNALIYNGTSWSLPTDIDGIIEPTSVSCVSASFCVAVDWEGNAITYNGTSWTSTRIDTSSTTSSISCPSSGFCAAVDYNGNAVMTAADFGKTAATSVTCTSTTSCSALSPVGPSGGGGVNVTVTTGGGISGAVTYIYIPVPTLTFISPTSGTASGGTTVTLTGTGFSTVSGGTTVDFGTGNPAISVTCPSTTSCTAVSPFGFVGGTVSVTVTTLGGTSNGVSYTYIPAPTLTSISPTSGPASGATTVTLTGTNFSTTTSGTTVSFGSTAATSVSCSTTSSCSAVSPSGTGTVSVTVTTSDGTSNALSYTYTTYSGYNSLVPYRICDTRSLSVKGTFQNQCTGKTILPGGYLTIQVVGYQGNAASGASIVPNGAMAVVLNVTEASSTSSGYLTVYPAGATKPASSSLNFNQTTGAIPNLVQVSLGNTSGCSGCITVYNYNGNTDIAIDVEGYFGPVSQKGQGSFVPLTPYRICDTRSQTLSKITDQCTGKTISAGQTLSVQVSGYQGTAGSLTGVVRKSAKAVVLNVTEADATSPSYLTVYPAGGMKPASSNLNFTQSSKAVANFVTVPISSSGYISIYNYSGSTDVIVDVVGWYG